MILSAKNLGLTYPNKSHQVSKLILSGLNFDFKPGSFMGLLGKNGSGKTTLLKALSGIMPPSQGEISLDDHLLYDLPSLARARAVAMVTTIWPSNILISARDVLLLGRYPYLAGATYKNEDHHIVNDLAKLLNIQEFLERSFFELSDGQRQKIMIGRALVQKTKFLFLDEPFTFLDIKQKDWMFEFLRSYAQTEQVGILFSTHDRFIVDQLENVFALDQQGCGAILAKPEIASYLANF